MTDPERIHQIEETFSLNPVQTFIVGANPGGQGPGRGLQKGRREGGRFPGKPVKSHVGHFQHDAVGVGNDIRRPRTVIEQRHVAEKIAGAERGQNRLFFPDHHPRPQFALQDEEHAVARIALFHHRRPLRHLVHFHEFSQAIELGVVQLGQDFDAPQRAGFDARTGSRGGIRNDCLAEMRLKFGNFRRPPPTAIVTRKHPGIGQHPFVADPVDQDRQFHRAVGGIVNSPDKIIIGNLFPFHARTISQFLTFLKAKSNDMGKSFQANWIQGSYHLIAALIHQRKSFRVRIRAEDFDEVAMLAQKLDGLDDLAVLHVAVAINEEEIFPRLPLARARFNLRHVDFVTAERGNRLMQRAGLVGHADQQAGAVVAGGRTALAAEHEEARGVGGVVLNVLFEHGQAVFFGGQDAGDGGHFPAQPEVLPAGWATSSADRALEEVSRISACGRFFCTQDRHWARAWGWT